MSKKTRHGKVFSGHTVPYGTFSDVDQEISYAYYHYGYRNDSMMPELPCPQYYLKEWVDPEEELSKKELASALNEVLDSITPREKKVLCLRFGIGLGQDYTLDQVAVLFDVSGSRIRQIEAKALRKLKHPDRAEPLRQYLFNEYLTSQEKKREIESAQARWAKARDHAHSQEKVKNELNLALDKKKRDLWQEIKPIIGDVDWVAHMKAEKPEMYRDLLNLTKTIWGKDTQTIWQMFTKETA